MKIKIRIMLIIFLVIGVGIHGGIVNAETVHQEIEEEVEAFTYTISSKGLNKETFSEIIAKYRELSENYSNDQIADMIENAKKSLEQENIGQEHIENIESLVKILRGFETADLIKIMNSIDIDRAIEEMTPGSTLLDLVKKAASNMSTQQKAGLFASFILSSKIVHTILTVLGILGIYQLFTRAVIYKKAHQHAWAVLIPIYKDIVMLRICGLSAWWLLLLFIPIVGWFILWLVHVASRFMLAEGFKKSEWFGMGLWILWPIFETILVFSKKTKYIGWKED